jgi:hypothetical protein
MPQGILVNRMKTHEDLLAIIGSLLSHIRFWDVASGCGAWTLNLRRGCAVGILILDLELGVVILTWDMDS